MKQDLIFSLRVKEILKEKKLTQKDLAARLDVSPQYISNILNAGAGVSVNALVEFAKALDVEFRDLFATTKDNDSPIGVVCPHCGKTIKINVSAE